MRRQRYNISISILIIALAKAVMWTTAETGGMVGAGNAAIFLSSETTNLGQFAPKLTLEPMETVWRNAQKVEQLHVMFGEILQETQHQQQRLVSSQPLEQGTRRPLRAVSNSCLQKTSFSNCDGQSESASSEAASAAAFNRSFLPLLLAVIACLFHSTKHAQSSDPKTNLFVMLLVGSSIFGTALAQQTPTPTPTPANHWGWLNSLLQNFTIPIPDQQITVAGNVVQFSTTNGFCNHFHLNNLQSTVSLHHQQSYKSLNTTVEGLGLACSLHYQAKLGGFVVASGIVDAAVGDPSQVDGVLTLGFNDVFLPVNASLDYCRANVNITDLTFHGSASADLIDLFSPVIRAMLTSEINAQVCSVVEPLVAVNLTQILTFAEKLIDPLMRPAHTPSPTPAPSNAVDWQGLAGMNTVQYFLQTKAGAAIRSGLSWATQGTGAVQFVFDHEMGLQKPAPVVPLPISFPSVSFSTPFGNITGELASLFIGGLDSLNNVTLFNATGGPNVFSSVELDNLRIEVGLVVSVTKPQGGESVFNVTAGVSLAQLTGWFGDALVVDKTGVLGLRLIDLTQLACVLDRVISANATNLGVSFSALSEVGVVGLGEADFVINNTIAIALALFEPALELFTANAGNSLVLPELNNAITRILATGRIFGLLVVSQQQQQLASQKGSAFEDEPQSQDSTYVNAVSYAAGFDADQHAALSDVVSTFVRRAAPKSVENGFNSSCNPPPPPATRGNVDFTTDPVVALVHNLLSRTLANMTSPLNINKLLHSATNGTGTVVVAPGTLVNTTLVDPSSGYLWFEISHLSLHNLDSFFVLDLVDAISPTTFQVQLGLGACSQASCKPFGVSANIGFLYEHNGQRLGAELELEIMLSNLFVGFQVELDISNHALWDVTLSDFVGPHAGACVAAQASKLALYQPNITFSDIGLSINIGDGLESSATAKKALEAQVQRTIAHHLKQALPSIADMPSSANITLILVDAIRLFTPLAASQLNSLVADKLKDASHTCYNDHGGTTSTTPIIAGAVGAVVGVVLLVAGVVVARKSKGRRSRLSGLSTPLTGEDILMPVVTPDHGGVPQTRARAVSHGAGLHTRAEVPMWAKVCIPIGLIGVFAMFISAHTGTGATVTLYLFFGETTVVDFQLFRFTLANSVRDMWNAKVYALSLLIAVCSGGWPYLKTILLGVAWLFPRNWLRQHRRATLLMWLDMLGKWSLIDAYVLVLFVVAFRFHIANPAFMVLPEGVGSADVIVGPGWGIYGFIIATILQLILTHLIIHFHREAEGRHQHMRDATSGQVEAVREHKFRVGKNSLQQRVQCTWFGQILVGSLLAICIALIIVGSIWDSFSFHFEGAAEVVLRDVHSPSDSSYSLLSLASNVASSTLHPNSVGVRFLQATYVIFVFVIPVIHMATILLVWLLPMRVPVLHGFFIAVEVLNAWASLEVFVVSIIAAILEISQFARFIVGDKCDQVNVLLREVSQILPWLYPPTAEMQCFDVETTLNSGCWVLFSASLCAIVIGQLVTRSCQRALRERVQGVSLILTAEGHETPSDSEEDTSNKKCCSCCSSTSISGLLSRLRMVHRCTSQN